MTGSAMVLARFSFPGTYDLRAAFCKAALVMLLLGGTIVPASAETFRIVAIGDSLTHGFGLPEDEGFVPQLERWLVANGEPDAEVINMGVSGDTTAGGLARLDWALSDGADAVIIALGGNDLLRGIDPASSRSNLDAMMRALDARDIPVLLAGMQAPLNYGPDYKDAFDRMYPELAETHGAVLYPFFLEGIATDPALNQADGIHPNAEGTSRMAAQIGPSVLRLINGTEQ